MSRFISKAEGWEAAYTAFQNINFAAYDYHTIKQSMIEYLQMYFPETFNDYIESSEFIALLEIFAYLGELAAYRMDMNANENSIMFAQRKQSVLRLAKLISYNASRNIAARGVVKITSISTTERVRDANDQDISNRVIEWNDTNNPNWKNQFITVIQRIMQQSFGSVSPKERVQVENMLYELYPLNNQQIPRGVIEYSASASGTSYPMELVSSQLHETGPREARPSRNSSFNVIYASDGLGDASSNTGFFVYTKQGTLRRTQQHFDGVIPNQTHTIGATDINNSDVWVNHVDPDTGMIIDDSANGVVSGEWEPVDLSDAQNIIFNTQQSRNKYEIETLEDDDVRLIFGDGEFSDIPSGMFDIWYRVSANEDVFIPQNSIVDKRASFKYVDVNGKTQTITFTYSLVNSIQNGSKTESVDHIRRVAPSTHYSQNRMVNAPDYNTLPLRQSSILKLKTINRTFVGDSAYGVSNSINDASFTYQDVKLFGDDLHLFYKPSSHNQTAPGTVTASTLITNYIEPLLSTVDQYLDHILKYDPSTYTREFSPDERQQLLNVINNMSYPWPINLVYVADGQGPTGSVPTHSWVSVPNTTPLGSFSPNITIDLSDDESGYTITSHGQRLVAESPNTRFFNDNSGERVLSFDTLAANQDTISILKANVSSTGKLLTSNIPLRLLQVERHTVGAELAGLPNYNQVSVATQDINSDLIPDNMDLPDIIDQRILTDIDVSTEFNNSPVSVTPYIYGEHSDISYQGTDRVQVAPGSTTIDSLGGATNTFNVMSPTQIAISGDRLVVARYGNTREYTVVDVMVINGGYEIRVDDSLESWTQPGCVVSVLGQVASTVSILTDGDGGTESGYVVVRDYVYFSRDTSRDPYTIVPNSANAMRIWWVDQQTGTGRYRRLRGRSQLNFLWQHYSSDMNLVDPAPTNIQDMFVITKPYYSQFVKWVNGDINNMPDVPTPSQLRNSYSELLNAKMISDTVIMHHGKIKLLFGAKAAPELQAKIKVIRTSNPSLTDNQLKIRIVNVIRRFFEVDKWEFGESFFYSELDTAIKNALSSQISSTVLVPSSPNHRFGDLYQIYASEDEILQVNISVDQIEVVDSYNARNIQQIVD